MVTGKATRKASMGFYKEIAIQSIVHRCGNICGICGEPLKDPIIIDHIIPVLYGGTDNIDNLRAVHLSCHSFRHGKLRAMDIAEENIRRERIKRNKTKCKQAKTPIRRKYEEETARTIKEMKDKGKRITHIAKELNVSRPTVYDYLRKAEAYITESGNA